MSELSGRILDLVCGLPSPKREARCIMALQAYIDDSMADGHVLVLAGYISTAERWAAFSDEWQARLDMKPPLKKFHMVDVDQSSELQMERVRHFYRVIEDYAIAGTAVAVDLKQLADLQFDASIPSQARKPYMLAFKAIIDNTLQHQLSVPGLSGPIDFIFDQRSEKKLVQEGFEHYEHSVPEELRRLVGRSPLFEDDEEFLPLQAADLLAFWARRHWLNCQSICKSGIDLPVLQLRSSAPIIVLDVAGRDLQGEADAMARAYRSIQGE